MTYDSNVFRHYSSHAYTWVWFYQSPSRHISAVQQEIIGKRSTQVIGSVRFTSVSNLWKANRMSKGQKVIEAMASSGQVQSRDSSRLTTIKRQLVYEIIIQFVLAKQWWTQSLGSRCGVSCEIHSGPPLLCLVHLGNCVALVRTSGCHRFTWKLGVSLFVQPWLQFDTHTASGPACTTC